MGDTQGDEKVDTGGAGEAAFVGVVLVALFFALCRGWYTPEVVGQGSNESLRDAEVLVSHAPRIDRTTNTKIYKTHTRGTTILLSQTPRHLEPECLREDRLRAIKASCYSRFFQIGIRGVDRKW
ncbi:unnamed protein product [Ectocarpus sp. 13 AM-2016]